MQVANSTREGGREHAIIRSPFQLSLESFASHNHVPHNKPGISLQTHELRFVSATYFYKR